MLGDFVDDGVHQRLRVLNLLSKEASPVCDLLDVGLLVDAALSIQQSVSARVSFTRHGRSFRSM